MPSAYRRVLLVILDGFGVNPAKANNAIALADTPNLDRYLAGYPHTTLQASGRAVGLPDGQMGNSEVGHITLGCGGIVRQDLVKIQESIAAGDFFANPVLVSACRRAKASGRPLHLLGLVSDGGVHSHLEHLLALIALARREGVVPLLHLISDGRDTAPHSVLDYLPRVVKPLAAASGAVASVCGRFFAMDRDRRWDRTERAWRMLALGKGRKAETARAAVEQAYAAGESDEFIQPTVLPAWQPVERDSELVLFNFRKDRPRQIVAALGLEDFHGFDRGGWAPARVSCMMPYDRSFPLPAAFEPEIPPCSLAEVLSRTGCKQLHVAETEKYAHVTFFFNGGRQNPFQGETQLLIPSPRVSTYDLAPEMSAAKIADAVINALRAGEQDFILVNFANGDMVGHTAIPDAVIQAVETLDRELGRVLDVAVEQGYTSLVTADHGNCEELVAAGGRARHTQHTSYPVPFLVVDRSDWVLSCEGGLSGVAPTVLQLLGLAQPEAMSGRSLLLREVERRAGAEPVKGAA